MKAFLLVLILGCAGSFAADSVAFARVGSVVTVTIKIDVTEIMAKQFVDKKQLTLERAQEVLRVAVKEAARTNAQIDADAAALKAAVDAEAEQAKALKPTGTL